MLSFGNTMVYVTTPSWNIPYAMKLWLNYSNKGFDGGLMQNRKPWGLNYMGVGKNHINGGRQGGAFMDPWKMGETILIRWSGCLGYSFDSSSS